MNLWIKGNHLVNMTEPRRAQNLEVRSFPSLFPVLSKKLPLLSQEWCPAALRFHHQAQYLKSWIKALIGQAGVTLAARGALIGAPLSNCRDEVRGGQLSKTTMGCT